MKSFTYERAKSPAEAAAIVGRTPGARFLAGGTNLLDLMKLEIETPTHLVDAGRLRLRVGRGALVARHSRDRSRCFNIAGNVPTAFAPALPHADHRAPTGGSVWRRPDGGWLISLITARLASSAMTEDGR